MNRTSPIVALILASLCSAEPARAQAAPVPEPTVKLLEPGAAPQKTLRFTPKKGDAFSAEMIMRMTMQQTMNGMQMPSPKTPAMRFVMELSVTDVQANGDIAYEFKFTDAGIIEEPGLMPQVVSMMKEQLKSMTGLKGQAVVSNRGITKSAQMQVPPGATHMIKQQIESVQQSITQFSSPLPEEPIGPGGKWQVEQQFTMSGMTLKQTTIMTLAASEGQKLDIAMDLTQTADAQDVKAPGMPAGAVLRLNSLKSTGDGKMVLDLARLLPWRAETNVVSDSTMAMTMNGAKQDIGQHMEISMTFADAPAGSRQPATAPKGH